MANIVSRAVPVATAAVVEAKLCVDERERTLRQQQTVAEAFAVKVQEADKQLARAKALLKSAQAENRYAWVGCGYDV